MTHTKEPPRFPGRFTRVILWGLLRVWTLSLIAELIHRQFGKTLSLSAVSRVMKLLGFTAQKPLYRAWQQDAARVRQVGARDLPGDSG